MPVTAVGHLALGETEPRLGVRLYVAGASPNSTIALANLRSALLLSSYPVGLEIIDILEDPERSVRDGVLVTPMLVKFDPPPELRILGTLEDRALLLSALGFSDRLR